MIKEKIQMKEEMFMKNNGLKNTKAITLIALVVTITILLILAGVIMAALIGENGILSQTKDATLFVK